MVADAHHKYSALVAARRRKLDGSVHGFVCHLEAHGTNAPFRKAYGEVRLCRAAGCQTNPCTLPSSFRRRSATSAEYSGEHHHDFSSPDTSSGQGCFLRVPKVQAHARRATTPPSPRRSPLPELHVPGVSTYSQILLGLVCLRAAQSVFALKTA